MTSDRRSFAGPVHRRSGRSACIVGLGNIGSPLAPLIARLTGPVGKLILVDGDVYDRSNLTSQAIERRDVGKPKAIVAASRLRGIDPGLEIVALPQRVEEAPRGDLRCDVILAALDSKRSRAFVNEIAARLSIPWIDAGVEAEGRLVRVSVYVPGQEAPCIECGFSDDDYETIDQQLPCAGDSAASETSATGAPAYLGALAASLAAAECEKILAGELDGGLVGRELVASAKHHTHFVTNLHRNPRCRFDHLSWEVERLGVRPDQLSVGQVLDGRLLAGKGVTGDRMLDLKVEPHRFVTKTHCTDCRTTADVLSLSGRQTAGLCGRCGGSTEAHHFYTLDRVTADALPDYLLRRSLANVGLLSGDVFSLFDGLVERHFELGA